MGEKGIWKMRDLFLLDLVRERLYRVKEFYELYINYN